jgi:beta-lactamase class A
VRFVLLALLAACSEPGPTEFDVGLIDASVVSPDAVVEHRVRDAVEALHPPAGTDWSLTFEDLQTGERVAIAGDAKHVSASSAKAWWVAAALDTTSIAAVTPYAPPIFQYSDNSAAGSVIDLVGVNEMNVWMWDVAGMTNSALTQWSYDKTRIATNSPRALGDDNYMTSDDAVTFLSRVYRKQILATTADQLLQWMTLSPNSGLGGWIPAPLPDAVAQGVMHKAGWLPPGCCSDDSYYNTSNDIGIVTVDGHAYAIAILARRGPDYDAQTAFVEHASCVVYKAFADDDSLVCN